METRRPQWVPPEKGKELFNKMRERVEKPVADSEAPPKITDEGAKSRKDRARESKPASRPMTNAGAFDRWQKKNEK